MAFASVAGASCAARLDAVPVRGDLRQVHSQLDEVVRTLTPQFPGVATMVAEASEDLLAFSALPHARGRQIWSTNPLEHLNGEIKRRTNVVGIFSNDAAITRLVTDARRVGGGGAPLPF